MLLSSNTATKQNKTTEEYKMENNTQLRYLVTLISYGGVLNETLSRNPWHPAKWMTYKGDIVRVFDTLDAEWYPDYVIESDGD
jgi:hypothetical protein